MSTVNPFRVLGRTVRPNNAADYAAGDVVGGLLLFPNVAKFSARGSYIVGAVLTTFNSAWDAALRLHLVGFKHAALVDNAALVIDSKQPYFGYLDFAAVPVNVGPAGAATGVRSLWSGQPLPIVGAGPDGQIVGILEARAAASPAAFQAFEVEIAVET